MGPRLPRRGVPGSLEQLAPPAPAVRAVTPQRHGSPGRPLPRPLTPLPAWARKDTREARAGAHQGSVETGTGKPMLLAGVGGAAMLAGRRALQRRAARARTGHRSAPGSAD